MVMIIDYRNNLLMIKDSVFVFSHLRNEDEKLVFIYC